jgi:hypothetical protein
MNGCNGKSSWSIFSKKKKFFKTFKVLIFKMFFCGNGVVGGDKAQAPTV